MAQKETESSMVFNLTSDDLIKNLIFGAEYYK